MWSTGYPPALLCRAMPCSWIGSIEIHVEAPVSLTTSIDRCHKNDPITKKGKVIKTLIHSSVVYKEPNPAAFVEIQIDY